MWPTEPTTTTSPSYGIISYRCLGKKLKALKLEDVEGLYRSMIASGLSSATVRYVHAFLRRAVKQAVVRGLVPRSTAEGANLPRMDRK
jgi:hypothetical protein